MKSLLPCFTVLIVSLCSTPLNRAATNMSPSEPKPSIGEVMSDIGFYQSIQVSSMQPLVHVQSDYQKIQIFESAHYGKILVLDNVIQLTERDADAYNEMMAHVPLFQHANPKRVLIIGGGDGFILKEVLKHPSVQVVDHVDLDAQVIKVCQEHLGQSMTWNDPRVTLHIADGSEFVKRAAKHSYDVIIQDSSDPWAWDDDGDRMQLPSHVLYESSHLSNLHRILSPGGVMNLQAESLQIPSDLDDIVEWRQDALEVGFSRVRYASIMISSYPTGQIGCFVCEKKKPSVAQSDPLSTSILAGRRLSSSSMTAASATTRTIAEQEPLTVSDRYQRMIQQTGHETSYYHPRLQVSSFDLPLWAERKIYGVQGLEGANELQE